MLVSMDYPPPDERPPDIEGTLEAITPAKAEEWLSEYLYDRQRQHYEPHVKELAYIIQQGQYSPQGITLCECEGRWHLTDGQHRLRACVLSGMTIHEMIIRKRGLTPRELADEYSRTDQGKKRRIADTMRAHDVGQEYGLTDAQVNYVSAAVGLVVTGFASPKPEIRQKLHMANQDERLALVEKWLPAGTRYFKAIKEPRKGRMPHLILAATVGVGLVTSEYSKDKAETFWYILAHETGEEDHPCQALLRYFSEERDERGKAPLVARRVARAWNAYYNDEQLSVIRRQDSAKPIEIAGSPFRGISTPSYLAPADS